MSSTGTRLIFTKKTQVALFNEELIGQISDGMWENTRNTDWLWMGDVKAEVGEVASIITSANRGKVNYRFTALIEYVGDRMMEICKAIDPNYSEKDLKADLSAISKVIKSVQF